VVIVLLILAANGLRALKTLNQTTLETLRLQKRDVLDYLTEACAAASRQDQPPSLLPQPPVVNAVT